MISAPTASRHVFCALFCLRDSPFPWLSWARSLQTFPNLSGTRGINIAMPTMYFREEWVQGGHRPGAEFEAAQASTFSFLVLISISSFRTSLLAQKRAIAQWFFIIPQEAIARTQKRRLPKSRHLRLSTNLWESMKGPQSFHQQSAGPALPIRGATECCFRYQFAAVK